MVRRQKLNQFGDLLLVIYLAVFPFGQLPDLLLQKIFKVDIRIHTLDLIVGVFCLLSLLKILKNRKLLVFLKNKIDLIFIASYSGIITLLSVPLNQSIIGYLYLTRLVTYILFFYFLRDFFKEERDFLLIKKSLILVGITVSLFGWIQYFLFYDLTSLKYFGWDDHLYRIVSTFLDPAYVGIIIVLTVILVISGKDFIDRIWDKKLVLIIFLITTLGFTYSRSSYLSLFLGLTTLFLLNRNKLKIVMFSILLLFALILILPRQGGEGVRLERTNSVYAKIENYKLGYEIYKLSPVFGVGYDNLCYVKTKYFGFSSSFDHSCSGLDNSVLVILTTFGSVGVMFFAKGVYHVLATTEKVHREVILVSGTATLTHSIFTNTLFYAWVMGWMALMLAVTRNKIREKN